MFEKWRVGPRQEIWTKGLVITLFVFSGAVFTLRGPFRALSNNGLNDLISPYVQSTAWVHGADPYSPQSLMTFWPKGVARPAAEEFQDGSILIKHGIPTAYPMTCFALLAPFTVVPWPVLKLLSVAVTTGLFCGAVWSLVALAGLDGWHKVVFVSAATLFAPFHTGNATCNPAIAAAELGLIAVWACEVNRKIASALLMSLSSGLKPQIGLFFLFYHIVRHYTARRDEVGRDWRVWGIALGTIVATAAIAVIRLSFAHVQWIPNYELDTHALLNSGILGDFTEHNPTRFGLINLQVALYPLLHDRQAANIVAYLLGASLLLAWVVLMYRIKARDSLLCLSTLSVISLLPVYHRFYDAAVLIMPLCWVAVSIKSKPNRSAGIGFAAMAVFFLPGGSLLETLRDRGTIPSALNQAGWWNSFVMAHAVWCLLALGIVLLYQMAASVHIARTAVVNANFLRSEQELRTLAS